MIHTLNSTVNVISKKAEYFALFKRRNFSKSRLIVFASAILFSISVNLQAQVKLPALQDSLFPDYHHQKHSFFKAMAVTKGDIIFLGDSITDGAEWNEMFQDNRMKNRGIGGDISAGILHRLTEILDRKPKKIFLLIGVNDLAKGIALDSLIKNMMLIADYTKQESPATQLYIQSILPVNNVFGKLKNHTNSSELIKKVNSELEKKAIEHNYLYIDLFSSFCNEEGKLAVKYTIDGVHLTGEGYLLWKQLITHFINDK